MNFRWWLVIGLLVCLMFAYIGGAVEGQSNMAITTLTVKIEKTLGTGDMLYVTDNTGFVNSGYIMLGNEKISYSSKFLTTSFIIDARGYSGTKVEAYSVGTKIYSPEMGALAAILGYDVISDSGAGGPMVMLNLGQGIVLHAIPKVLSFDYIFLSGETWLIFIRILLIIIFGLPLIIEGCILIATVFSYALNLFR
jgi:hypothetical protein